MSIRNVLDSISRDIDILQNGFQTQVHNSMASRNQQKAYAELIAITNGNYDGMASTPEEKDEAKKLIEKLQMKFFKQSFQ